MNLNTFLYGFITRARYVVPGILLQKTSKEVVKNDQNHT